MMDVLDPYPGNLKKHEVTSDPQAPYGKEDQRAPMLSDAMLVSEVRREDGVLDNYLEMTGEEVRDFYEAKITSGELMVVKTVTAPEWADNKCCGYASKHMDFRDVPAFCPRCGAKIIK